MHCIPLDSQKCQD